MLLPRLLLQLPPMLVLHLLLRVLFAITSTVRCVLIGGLGCIIGPLPPLQLMSLPSPRTIPRRHRWLPLRLLLLRLLLLRSLLLVRPLLLPLIIALWPAIVML